MSSFIPLFVITLVGVAVVSIVVWCLLYEDEIRGGFGWLGAKVILLGAAMLGLWILAIILVVSKLVGKEKRVVEVERDEKRERD